MLNEKSFFSGVHIHTQTYRHTHKYTDTYTHSHTHIHAHIYVSPNMYSYYIIQQDMEAKF